VAVSRSVDLLDPGAEPGHGFAALFGWELPPLRYRVGEVVIGVLIGRRGIGELRQGPLEVLHGAVEPGDLLVVSGELVEYGGERVGGHAQLHGNEVPLSGIQSDGTWSGIPGSGGRSAAVGAAGGRRSCS
jgi:hypothetical protein